VSPVRAALLDLYDTLAWTEWPRLRELLSERTGLAPRTLMNAFSKTRPRRAIGEFGSVEGDLRAVLEAAGAEVTDELVNDLARLEREELERGVHLWDDALPTIGELRERGLRVAVVSNCDHSTRPIVNRIGITAAVDAVILSFEVGVAKPNPGIYLAALDALGGLRPEDAVFVDDQARYCDAAAALGIGTVLILREEASPGEGVSDPGDHRVIRDLRALMDLVELV
jgi:putative hydrolase of the HAD superfamily